MKKHFMISIWMTIVTTLLLGVIYPLVVTALAQVCRRDASCRVAPPSLTTNFILVTPKSKR